MRGRIGIIACLVLCMAIAVFAWFEGRPRHFVVHGGTNFVGVMTKANPSAYIVSHHAAVQNYPAGLGLEIGAVVRDVRGATIRCDLPDYPGLIGGTDTLKGGRGPGAGTTLVMWSSTKIDHATLVGCILGLRRVPKYTLEYTTPRSNGWCAVSIVALLAGPVLSLAIWAAVNHPLRWRRSARRGFEVVEVSGSGPSM